MAMGHADAEDEFRRLQWRYPELPNEVELRIEIAKAKEAAEDLRAAAAEYRRIDVLFPGHPGATEARQRLNAMLARGLDFPDMTRLQRVQRAERLVYSGPFAMAREAIDALEDDEALTTDLRARVALMQAQMARVEGRWAEARTFMQLGLRASGDADDLKTRMERATDLAEAADSRGRAQAEERIERVRRGRALHKMPTAALIRIVRLAARASMYQEAQEAMDLLMQRDLPPQIRFNLAIAAVGSVREEQISELFQSVTSRPGSLGVAARYHHGRALERLGRLGEAEAEYVDVLKAGQADAAYYAVWANVRLRAVRTAMVGHCEPGPTCVAKSFDPAKVQEPHLLAALRLPDLSRRRQALEGMASTASALDAPTRSEPDLEVLAAKLLPVAQNNPSLPWLMRAVDLLELGEPEPAKDELYDAFLAWREATGNRILRAGVDSVYRGADRRRSPGTIGDRMARARLSQEDRETLFSVAGSLGEHGTAVGFGGWAKAGELPRAHATAVERAARRHGLDPNLLFAVMRVESVYQRHIVSYAGAIGLMQIMPRTGQHIANELGKRDFTIEDLLNPETNLEFAAWYLASLIRRFEGRLPLAIASYNGGPHNVRRWLRDAPITMPLEAFLEEIPFEQTHRYVRRVLTHYAAYRAQQGLAPEHLGTRLPIPKTDLVAF